MKTVTRFEPLSVMKISGVCYALMGLVFGAVFSVVFTLAGSMLPLGQDQVMPPFFRLFFGVFSVIFLPIFYGVLGALMGGLGAVVYNVAAKRIGGIQVEVE